MDREVIVGLITVVVVGLFMLAAHYFGGDDDDNGPDHWDGGPAPRLG